MRSWYDVLGVAPASSIEEVRTAYRAQARALHPDTRDPGFPGAEADAALGLVRSAWAVLGDPDRRASYDEALEQGSFDADEEPWRHGGPHGRRFPWWIVALAVLAVIFVFTAYAGGPAPVAPAR